MANTKPDFCMRCPVGGTLNEADQTCSVQDPEDGLPLACVGGWAEKKHARIKKYVDISRAVRRKFVNGKGGATYIDLFCGPGRARVRETTRIIDGSALVAAKEAIESKTPFSELHIADSNESFVSAARTRLDRLGVTAKGCVGRSQDTVGQITAVLPQFALHFAFLDPYDLKGLPFLVIEQLAAFGHMDILIHVSAQDLQRNLRRYIKSRRSSLDSFAPRWRDVNDQKSFDFSGG